MANYALEYADGRVTEIVADNDTDAEFAALARIGDDAVAAEQWDADGCNDDERTCERLLLWSCEADSINDAGQKSIAKLTVVR